MPKFGNLFDYSKFEIEDDVIVYRGLGDLNMWYDVFDMTEASIKIYNYEDKVIHQSRIHSRHIFKNSTESKKEMCLRDLYTNQKSNK